MAEAGEERNGDDEKRPEAGKDSREASRPRANLIAAIDHPARRGILRALGDSGRSRSPNEIAAALSLPLGAASYHLLVLTAVNAIGPAGERAAAGPVDGRHYESTIENDAPIEALLEETRARDEALLAERAKHT